jgi:MYXO-CTERM domain-containing protein
VASTTSGGSIELRLGSATGTLIGTCTVPATGGAQTWVTTNCSVTGATGVKDLYLKFTGSTSFNFDYWQFSGQNGGAGGTGSGGTATGGRASGGLASGGKAMGGATATGGTATGGTPTGGTYVATGGQATGGASVTPSGGSSTGGTATSGGTTAIGGTAPVAGTGGSAGSPEGQGCNCRTAPAEDGGHVMRLGLFGLCLLAMRRRRARE